MEYTCYGCHTDHVADDSFDGLCPNCGSELPDALIQEIEDYLWG